MSERLVLEPRMRPEEARAEAMRCLQCFDAPCIAACPAGIVIPRFIRMLQSGNHAGAAEAVRAANPLASSCGVACPDEQICGAACLRAAIDRPIEIRRLHRYATETGEGRGLRATASPGEREAFGASSDESTRGRPTGRTKGGAKGGAKGRTKRVAVIGAGPAGLACAHELRRAGLAVTVFEQRPRVGGVLAHTIPLYRFPEEAITRDARWTLGAPGEVTLRLRSKVLHPPSLRREFDALFLAIGLSDLPPDFEGRELRGVQTAEEFLARTRAARYRQPMGSEVAVLGGGNVAIDAALAAVRSAQERKAAVNVHLLYRRTRREMPAWEREVALAEQAGVHLHFLVAPERFVGTGRRLTGIELSRTRLARAGAGERPRPVPVPGSRFVFPCDQAVLATGQRVDPDWRKLLPATRDGYLRTRGRTHQVADGIFAGGDAAGAEQRIVSAVRTGREAAAEILSFLGGGR